MIGSVIKGNQWFPSPPERLGHSCLLSLVTDKLRPSGLRSTTWGRSTLTAMFWKLVNVVGGGRLGGGGRLTRYVG